MFGLIPHWEESDYTEFRWEDVKYDLIPFIEELKKWTLNKQPSFVTQKIQIITSPDYIFYNR
jgi:hypothetical protein